MARNARLPRPRQAFAPRRDGRFSSENRQLAAICAAFGRGRARPKTPETIVPQEL